MNEQTLESIFRLDGANLSVVPFKSYLLRLMDLHDHDEKHLKQLPNYSELLDSASEYGYGYAILDQGKPVLCFGVMPEWHGVVQLWMI